MSDFTQEDRDMLIRVDERTKVFTERFASHVKHHWMISIPVGLFILGLVVKLLV